MDMVARQGATGTPSEYACTIATKWTLPVFPCKPTKAPYTAHGFKDATLNLVQIREWFARWPDALVAVPTGAASKLLVVDVDVKIGVTLVQVVYCDTRHLLHTTMHGRLNPGFFQDGMGK